MSIQEEGERMLIPEIRTEDLLVMIETVRDALRQISELIDGINNQLGGHTTAIQAEKVEIAEQPYWILPGFKTPEPEDLCRWVKEAYADGATRTEIAGIAGISPKKVSTILSIEAVR